MFKTWGGWLGGILRMGGRSFATVLDKRIASTKSCLLLDKNECDGMPIIQLLITQMLKNTSNSLVGMICFDRPFDEYVQGCKGLDMDLRDFLAKDHLIVTDCVGDKGMELHGQNVQCIDLSSMDVFEQFKMIKTFLLRLKREAQQQRRPLNIFIDGITNLFGHGWNTKDLTSLLRGIDELQQDTDIRSFLRMRTDIEEWKSVARWRIHESTFVMLAKALNSGASKLVSGKLLVFNGGRHTSENDSGVVNNYLLRFTENNVFLQETTEVDIKDVLEELQ